MSGGKRCRMHGGDTSRRPHAPRFKHGLYSQVLDPKLRDDYEAAVKSVQADEGVSAVESGIGVRVAAVNRFYREHPAGPSNAEEYTALMHALGAIDKAAAIRKELRTEDKPEGDTVIQVANISANPISNVRGPDGAMTQMLNLPDGTALLRCADGAWRPCEPFSLSGVSCYRPVLQLGDSQ